MLCAVIFRPEQNGVSSCLTHANCPARRLLFRFLRRTCVCVCVCVCVVISKLKCSMFKVPLSASICAKTRRSVMGCAQAFTAEELKLSRSEWNSIEMPVDAAETVVLRMICDGVAKSLFTYLKVARRWRWQRTCKSITSRMRRLEERKRKPSSN